MTINKYIILGVSLLLTFALGFIGGLYLKKPQIISNPVPIYVKGKDSLVIEKHYYIVHDTVKVIEKHFFKVTEYVKAEVKDDTASTTIQTEKVFDSDTLKHKIEIKYSVLDSTFNVNQSFDLVHVKEFVTDTIKIQVPTEKIIYKDTTIWEKPYVNFIFGVIVSVLIFFLSGN